MKDNYPLWGVGGCYRKKLMQMNHSADENVAREEIAKRLARVAGHANSLKRLWKEDRRIDEILTQVAAVRAALDQVGLAMLELHIDECVAKAVQYGESAGAIRELKEALDRFI